LFLFTLLAVLAFFPMIFSGLMTLSAVRNGEYGFASKSAAIFLVCLIIVVASPKGKPRPFDDCEYYGRFADTC